MFSFVAKQKKTQFCYVIFGRFLKKCKTYGDMVATILRKYSVQKMSWYSFLIVAFFFTRVSIFQVELYFVTVISISKRRLECSR